jgi:hypothetical protein
MIEKERVIASTWYARAFFHLSPAFFAYAGIATFLHWPLAMRTPGDGIEILGFAAVIATFFELVLLGKRLQIGRDQVIYRYAGFPLFLRHVIRRNNISSYVQGHYRYGKTPASYVKVFVNTDGQMKEIRVNLSIFALSDSAYFYRWLAESVERGRPVKE